MPVYKDNAGAVISDWTSYSGYATSKCAEAAAAAGAATGAAEAGAEIDGAAYLSFATAIGAAVAALAF